MIQITRSWISSSLIEMRDKYLLLRIKTIKVIENNLIKIDRTDIKNIFSNNELTNHYNNNLETIAKLRFPELSGGINVGDQKALYFLINHFKPNKILEIGTHIGCSLANILLALKNIKSNNSEIDCIDLIDVNDRNQRNWEKYGGTFSPMEIVKKLEVLTKVYFFCTRSKFFLETNDKLYDFIFIDGGHKSDVVYYDIALSIKKLSSNGIILLHDYYKVPNRGNELDVAKKYKTGIFLACERIAKENGNIKVIPLESLPWETKIGTKLTSLAIVSKK